MKKALSVLLVVAMLCTLFVACSSGGDSTTAAAGTQADAPAGTQAGSSAGT